MNKPSVHCKVQHVTVTFSRWGQTVKALEEVSLEIPRGQWLMLVGPNGSGKSTLLKVLSGRRVPEGGQAYINGQEVRSMADGRRAKEVFLVHQDPLLGTAKNLTVFENLLVADYESYKNGASRQVLEQKYGKLLRPLGLADRLKQRVQTLSGGERQLLTLLIAQLRPALLILLDEPLAALDPAKADMCLKQITELHRLGKTLVHVTHNLEHAVSLGDRTVALNDGQMVHDELGKTRSLDSLGEHWQWTLSG